MPLQKEYLTNKNICRATFHLENKYSYAISKVNLVGDFNSWSSSETPLIKQQDGSYKVTIDLPINEEFQFRYLINGDIWVNDSKADKYCPAPIGNVDNSIIITTMNKK